MASSDEPVALAARCAGRAMSDVFLASDPRDRARREERSRDAVAFVGLVAKRTGIDADTAGAVLFLAMDGVATRGATLSPGGGGAEGARCAEIARDPGGYLAGLPRR